MAAPRSRLAIRHFFALEFLNFAVLFNLIGFCAAEDQRYRNCTHNFSCGGSIGDIGYPFWGGDRPPDCGVTGLELRCSPDNLTTINITGESYRVLSIDVGDSLMRIVRTDLLDGVCQAKSLNSSSSIDNNSGRDEVKFEYSHDVEKVYLLYSCLGAPTVNISKRFQFNCSSSERSGETLNYAVVEALVDYKFPNGTSCEHNLTVPVRGTALKKLTANSTISITNSILTELVEGGFEMEYKLNATSCTSCLHSGGLCWSGTNSHDSPTCLCRSGLPRSNCGNGLPCSPSVCSWSRPNLTLKIGIGVGAAAFTAVIMLIIFFIYHRRYKKLYAISSLASHGSSSNPQLTKELEKAGIHIFPYQELEEATEHFDPQRELGDGGFGTVYKGKLLDGRTVAVKRLHEYHYKRVEQFINEVEILTRLRHQNLVTLYGCTSYSLRELILVYEYIPNGTLADHLHGQWAKPGSLSLITRLNIAIETASALAFLHASDVIHRDIKSTNILLDKNFTAKVADFGLSRVLPMDVTHVSTAPQGTPGYVDPEYNEFYQLTEKSDVYSFGVVLMELISSKPAVDITRCRNEINLSAMAMNKIKKHALHELVDPHLGFDSDYKARAMTVAVAELGFQCLQMERDMRPDMQEVLEGLHEILGRDYSTDVVDITEEEMLLFKGTPVPFSPE